MSEQLTDKIEELWFKTLRVGNVVHVTTGVGDDAFMYDFDVLDTSGHWPVGTLSETRPDGSQVGPLPMELHGCGKWTDRHQNPVQKQARAFTPCYEGLLVGSFLMTASPDDHPNRLTFDKAGQEISGITVTAG